MRYAVPLFVTLLAIIGTVATAWAAPPRPPMARCAAAATMELKYGEERIEFLGEMLSPRQRPLSNPTEIAGYERDLVTEKAKVARARKVLAALPSKAYPAATYAEFEDTPMNQVDVFMAQCAAAYVK